MVCVKLLFIWMRKLLSSHPTSIRPHFHLNKNRSLLLCTVLLCSQLSRSPPCLSPSSACPCDLHSLLSTQVQREPQQRPRWPQKTKSLVRIYRLMLKYSLDLYCIREQTECKHEQVKGLRERKPTKRWLTGTMSKLRSASVTKPNARDGVESLWGRGMVSNGQGAAMEWNGYTKSTDKENVSAHELWQGLCINK